MGSFYDFHVAVLVDPLDGAQFEPPSQAEPNPVPDPNPQTMRCSNARTL
jgi:hypothetical protein